MVWAEDPPEAQAWPWGPDGGPPPFLGPAILPLDGGLSSWCPPACGPPFLPVFLCLLSQAPCDLDSHAPNPASCSSRLPACLLPQPPDIPGVISWNVHSIPLAGHICLVF